jgi:membrane protein insertase Oxa1/YidC/SpoIIIJ
VNVTAAAVGNALVFQLVNVVMGVAFGMLLLNSPLAIVLYVLPPTLWSTLGGPVDGLRTAAG